MNKQQANGKETLDARALDLFADSLQQPQGQRLQWLEQQCSGEPELFRRVMRLRQADEASSGFLSQPPALPAEPDRQGERLGAFEIIGELAAGGMSVVYRGRRADGAFEQDVAIKLFRSEMLSPGGISRFNAERQILASLEHPGIARIIDAGTAADGTPYVVMELVDGQPITHYCEQRKADLPQRLGLCQQLCSALDAAHRRGVVHRDIKPGNVLVTQDGQVRVIDFGIAKLLQSNAVMDQQLPQTRPDQPLYTPEYASPEQILGQPVGVASDVYSLGVMLYELLTGARPYHINEMTPSGIETTVCHTVPADPSQQVARLRSRPPVGLPERNLLRRKLKGDLDRIVMTAMSKEPGRRYDSAAALAGDIENYFTGQPVRARGASRSYRLKKFVGRHPGASAASAITLLTLLGALLVVSQQVIEARQQAERAEAAKNFLVEMIGRSDPYGDAASNSLAHALKQAIPSIEEQFGRQPGLEAEMRYAIGFALTGQGELVEARRQLEAAHALYQRVGSPLERARVLNALAVVSWDESDYAAAEQQFAQALELVRDASGTEALRLRFNVLTDYGGLMPKMDRPEVAISLLEQALDLLANEQGMEIELRDQAVLWNNLATAYDQLEDYERSIAAYRKSIAMHRQVSPDGSPDLATALANLGLTYEYVDRMDEAVDTVGQATEMQRRLLGPDHPQYVLALFNLGSLQKNAGDLQGAIEHMRQAAASAKTAYPPVHLYPARFNQRLAEAYAEAGQTGLAQHHAQIALGIMKQLPDVKPEWLESASSLAAESAEN